VSHGRTELGVAHPYVDYDNFTFAYEAAKRLAAKGRKHVSMISANPRFTFGHHLRDGLMRAAQETGISYELETRVTLDDDAETLRQATMARIAQGKAPDAYVCPGDAVALAVIAGIVDSGLQVGRDADIVQQTAQIHAVPRLPQALGHAVGERPDERIDRATGRERYDDAQRLRREWRLSERVCRGRQREQYRLGRIDRHFRG